MEIEKLKERLKELEKKESYSKWESGFSAEDFDGKYTADLNSEWDADGNLLWIWVGVCKKVNDDDFECFWSGDYVKDDNGKWVMVREIYEWENETIPEDIKHCFDYSLDWY